MDLILTRKEFRTDGIFSELTQLDGTPVARTLEHAYISPQGHPYAKIPNGTFKCIRGQHRLHNMTHDFTTFEITGVRGHKNLLFHQGNYNRDSEGCILLGTAISSTLGHDQMIVHSKIAFSLFMSLQDGVDEFMLTVREE